MSNKLVRGTGLLGALVIELGSILGPGAYVSFGLSADFAGDNLVFAILIAAIRGFAPIPSKSASE